MKRGNGKIVAENLGVSPSTVSRNKERPDVQKANMAVEQTQTLNSNLTKLNGNDLLKPNSEH